MKKRMLKAVTLITIITSSNLSVAQEENIKPIKHSVGLNYSYSDWDELSFDFNYRRFFNGFNLKGAIQLTSPYNYNYGDNDINSSKLEYYNHPQLLSNIDTNGKFYGLDENYYQRERYVKIKVGVEKVFPSKSSVNVFVSADLYVGLYNSSNKSNVNYYQLDSVENFSDSYWDSQYRKFGRFISEVNTKTIKQNNIVLGARLNAGLIINLTKRFFITTELFCDFSSAISKTTSISLTNSDYEESFSNKSNDVTYLYNNYGGSLGLNYKF
jgi:hypothetical protein